MVSLVSLTQSVDGASMQIKTTPGEGGDFWLSGGVNAGAGQLDYACGDAFGGSGGTPDLWHYYSG